MIFKNAPGQGKRYFGLHFYSGIAQYQEEDHEPYRVYLNEDTLRRMDKTFEGRPIFVEHVDDVEPDLNQLRKEADGWVLRSFYNECDGKHWVEFLVVSDRGERAIRNGMRLSNAYIPKSFKEGGLWNGVPYTKEITDGEYEHLAIVENPRYEESVIYTPEEFKKYNEEKEAEIKKLSNSKKGKTMKFSFFKKTKVENGIDPELEVILPKSGKTISLGQLLQNADKEADLAMGEYPKVEKGEVVGKKASSAGEDAKSHAMANMDHMVKMHDGSYMKIKDMMQKHKDMYDELEDMKKSKKDSSEKELDLKVEPKEVEAEGDLHNIDADSEHDLDEHEMEVAKVEKKEEMKDDLEHPEDVVHDEDEDKMEDANDPAEDQAAKKKALQLAEHEDKEIEEAKNKKNKKKNALEKADRLRTAADRALFNAEEEPRTVELSWDMVQRGKQRYGSN